MARKAAVIHRLEEHPNLPEVLGVLAQLAHIADADLPRLADSWHNTVALAEARDRALLPDSPLVCEVLAAFDAVTSLFEDDVRGEAAYLTVDPATTVRALKAVRDAIAAAYARPALSRGDHALLMRAWRAVYPVDTVGEPDLGPHGDEVRALLGAMPLLSTRCHDERGQAVYDLLVDQSFVEESARADARTERLLGRRADRPPPHVGAGAPQRRRGHHPRLLDLPHVLAGHRARHPARADRLPRRGLRAAGRRHAARPGRPPAHAAGRQPHPGAARSRRVQLSRSSAPHALTMRSGVTPHRCARSQPRSCQAS